MTVSPTARNVLDFVIVVGSLVDMAIVFFGSLADGDPVGESGSFGTHPSLSPFPRGTPPFSHSLPSSTPPFSTRTNMTTAQCVAAASVRGRWRY